MNSKTIITSQSSSSGNYQPLHWRSDYDKNIAVPAIQFSIRKVLNWDLGGNNLLYKYHSKAKNNWELYINRMNRIQRRVARDRLVDKKFTSSKNFDERSYTKFHREETILQKQIMETELDNPETFLTYYGLTHIGDLSNFDSRFFGLNLLDRLGHTIITGNSGFGKSLLMQDLFIQDVLRGYGSAIISSDHGGCQRILKAIPKEFQNKIVYWQPGNSDYEFGVDIFDSPNPRMTLETVLSIFGSIWQGESSDKISYFLEPILILIKDNPGFAKFSDYYRIIEDVGYRNQLLANCQDLKTINFWKNLRENSKTEMMSTLIKLEYINRNQLIKEILENKTKVLKLQKIVNEGLILIADLSLLPEGEASSKLIGNLIVKKLTECSTPRFFGLFVDEFWNYNGQDVLSRTSTLRQNHISLTFSQQSISSNTDNPQEEINWFKKFGTKILFNCNEMYSKIMNYSEDYEYDLKLKNLPRFCFWMETILEGMPVNPIVASIYPELVDGFVIDSDVQFQNNQDFFESFGVVNAEQTEIQINYEGSIQNSEFLTPEQKKIAAKCKTLENDSVGLKSLKLEILSELKKLTHSEDGKPRTNSISPKRRTKIKERIQELSKGLE
jgi:hypothetical protein